MLSPYTRATYRYTPLLALLLAPNEWLHPSFGKYLFAACDILAGVLMYQLLVSAVLPHANVTKDSNAPAKEPTPTKPQGETLASRHSQATLLTAIHLLNPLVFTISTRGSSESVLSLFVLLTLYCTYTSRWDAAAVCLGLSTHWKIYPFIYGVACLGVTGNEHGVERGWKGYLRSLVNWRTLRFGAISATSFALLGGFMYLM